MTVPPAVRDQFGPALLAELATNLWAIDCQTCGRGFGRFSRPVLGVRDYGDVATASLHHRRCLTEPWQRTDEVWLTGRPTLSWRTSVMVVSSGQLLCMVNPSCESAMIRLGATGWRLCNVDYFTKCGLVTNTDPELVPGLTAHLLPAGHLVAELEPTPGFPSHRWQWTMPPGHPLTARLAALDTVLIGVTTALRIGRSRKTEGELAELVDDQQIAFGLAQVIRG